MRLPGLAKAYVSPKKLTHYLLAADHPTGQYKATWLASLGFGINDQSRLTAAILAHAVWHDVAEQRTSAFGTTYVVEGTLSSPSNRRSKVRSVWFIAHGDDVPALVTLYPVRRSRS